MADLPPEQRDPTDTARPVATGANTDVTAVPGEAPQLLVMPSTDATGSMVWPGPEGAPAWAIPVQIPSGTRGYAVFIPMIPVQSPVPSPATAGPAVPPATAGPAVPPATAGPAVPPAGTGPAVPPSAVEPAAPPATPGPAVQPVPADPAARKEVAPKTDTRTTAEAAPKTDTRTTAEAAPAVTAGHPKPSGTPAASGADAEAAARRERPAATPAGPAPDQPSSDRERPAATPAGPAPDQPPSRGVPVPPPHPVVWERNRPAPDPRMNPLAPQVAPFGTYQPPPSAWRKFREKHWPGPAKAQGRAVPAGVLAGALGFVAFLPLDRVGIGWFLAWLVLTAGVVVAVRRTADLSHSERWIRSGWAVAALALLLVPAFRNAWWLVTFSVLGALGCAALAIVGGKQVRSILFSLFAAPYAAFRGIPWVRNHLQASRNPGMARRIVFSAGLTLVVLLVFGALLSSADVAFSALLDNAMPDLDVGSVFQWIFLAVAGGLIAVAGTYTLSAPPATSSLDTEGRGRFGLVEWAPACAGLVLLFGGFVAVQFTVLFAKDENVLKTTGLSYAEYARSGFWQLVAVTLLSLAVLAALARWAKRDEPADRMALRILLGLLCGLSLVIVASALTRMWTYQRVYSFTGERIFVMASEMLLGTIFVLIAVAGVRWRGRWIPGTTVGLAVLMLLGLAVLDPEGYVASSNAKRYADTGKIDAWYLRALSADATPALTELPDPVRRCTLSWIAEDLRQPDPWYAWNLGRSRARAALDRLGPGAVGNYDDCQDADQFDLPKKKKRK